MHKNLLMAIVVGFGWLLAPVMAEEASAEAKIVFEGTSTLHGFEGRVDTQPFDVVFRTDPETASQRISATAVVNVSHMTTEHEKRDRNMFRMFEPERFELITGTLTDAELPQTGTGTAMLRLKIRDVEQDVEAMFSEWKQEGNLITVNLDFPVSLKAFGLKAPSVMGVIRVGDTVNVNCSILAQIKSQPKGE